MSRAKNLEVLTESATQTEQIARIIGSNLKGGECIEMSSDIGGGKTTFTRGLVYGAGSIDAVSSPTFTIGKQYIAKKLLIYHFDFYRLHEPGLVAEELQEALENPNAVIVVEWAETVQKVLPNDRIKIIFERVATHEDNRTIRISAPEELTYLLKGISS
jgi:tRNA threonylcarbamoyladenosine biosynthesis protein TsaE